MEATFTFQTSRQQKALFGPMQNKQLKLLLKCPTPRVIAAVKETAEELLRNSKHQWKINVDIAAIVMAWGLEIERPIEEVEWVMRNFFQDDLSVGMESLLERAWPGKGFDYSECFEDYEEGLKKGRYGFLWFI